MQKQVQIPFLKGTVIQTSAINRDSGAFHGGNDYSAPIGTSIQSGTSGTVIWSGYNPGGQGYAVVVKKSAFKLALSVMLLLALSVLSGRANALQKEGGRCILSAEVLANPDLVLQDAMEHSSWSLSTNCNDVWYSEQETEFAHRGLKAYPVGGRNIPHSGDAIYRDFKIHGFKEGPDLEGNKTRIYDLELIYVAMTTIGPTVPICERSRVPMRVVQTPWGWRFMKQFSFGSNLREKIQRTKNTKEISELNDFASRCQLTLQ